MCVDRLDVNVRWTQLSWEILLLVFVSKKVLEKEDREREDREKT